MSPFRLSATGLAACALLAGCVSNNTEHAATTQDLEGAAREISTALGETPSVASEASVDLQAAGSELATETVQGTEAAAVEVADAMTEAVETEVSEAGAATAAALPIVTEGPALVGHVAPEFTLMDQHGVEHRLSDFRGQPVVLEWFNHGCPFVKKHYGSDNMQTLQSRYTEEGVVWLSICSSAEGKQGHTPRAELAAMTETYAMASTAVMADEDGTVGRLYGARNTPQMFVVDASGRLVYGGAIDDNSSASPDAIEGAHNYVAVTLDAMLAGEDVEPLETQPYGCGVKY